MHVLDDEIQVAALAALAIPGIDGFHKPLETQEDLVDGLGLGCGTLSRLGEPATAKTPLAHAPHRSEELDNDTSRGARPIFSAL